MELLGFDFDAGASTSSTHPFCGGVAEDVRITTRYREDDFARSFMGIVHETGHARYEQRLPRESVALPARAARARWASTRARACRSRCSWRAAAAFLA